MDDLQMSLGASFNKDEEEGKGKRDSGLMAITGSGAGVRKVASMDEIRNSRNSAAGRRGSAAGLDVAALTRLASNGAEAEVEADANKPIATSEILRMKSVADEQARRKSRVTGAELSPIQSGLVDPKGANGEDQDEGGA